MTEPYQNDQESEGRPEFRKNLRYWLKILPGSKKDYFLIFLAAVDILLLLVRNSYGQLLGGSVFTIVTIFDLIVIIIWALDFIGRFRREEDKLLFLQTYWYELVGVVPLIILRPFLLLRAAKLIIAYYKLGRSERDVSRLITQDITFRFRDVIVDTIADAVFLQSLQRVEEVMVRLDYSDLARKAFQENRDSLRKIVNDSLSTKSMLSELNKVPLMDAFSKRLGEDVSEVIIEVLETEVAGDIIKRIVHGVLLEMTDRVRDLDVERITGHKTDLEARERAATEGQANIT